LGFLSFGDRGRRDSFNRAIRQLEFYRRQLEPLRLKLQSRSKELFERTVKAMSLEERESATVFANELTELKKVLRVIISAELAMVQVIMRLETLRDTGDVVRVVSHSLDSLRKISKLTGVVQDAAQQVSSTLMETVAEVSHLTPNVEINVHGEPVEDIIQKAKAAAEERLRELTELPPPVLRATGATTLEKARRAALLATPDETEDEFKPEVYSYRPEEIRSKIAEAFSQHGPRVDPLTIASELNVPVTAVEDELIRMAREGIVPSRRPGGK
jgi:division protein CdvB (Snf7/Vps24/ESCRT-III family)